MTEGKWTKATAAEIERALRGDCYSFSDSIFNGHTLEASHFYAAAPALAEALEHALGLIVEFGDLNGFRNLSDAELGKAVVAVAEEARAALALAKGG